MEKIDYIKEFKSLIDLYKEQCLLIKKFNLFGKHFITSFNKIRCVKYASVHNFDPAQVINKAIKQYKYLSIDKQKSIYDFLFLKIAGLKLFICDNDIKKFEDLRVYVINYIFEIAFLDIENYFKQTIEEGKKKLCKK